MKKMVSKKLSLLLALVMIVSLVPINAFAAVGEVAVASIEVVEGKTLYENFGGCIETSDANGDYYYYFYDAYPITVEKATDGNWYSYQNGTKVNYTGFADNDNGTWYVENGKVTFTKNDIIKDTDGTWKYVVNSKFTKTNTVAKNSLGWWRIENGKVNFSANGVYQNENGWWKVEGGKVV